MDPPVAASAEKRQVVEVGASLGRSMPGNDVVCVASLEGGATEHTAPVAYRKSQVLGGRCMPVGPAEPQRPSVEADDHRRQVA